MMDQIAVYKKLFIFFIAFEPLKSFSFLHSLKEVEFSPYLHDSVQKFPSFSLQIDTNNWNNPSKALKAHSVVPSSPFPFPGSRFMLTRCIFLSNSSLSLPQGSRTG